MTRSGDGQKKEEVAVAIGKGKGSQYALKWAVDHLLNKGESVTILHVKQKSSSIPSPCTLSLPLAFSSSIFLLIFSHSSFQDSEWHSTAKESP